MYVLCWGAYCLVAEVYCACMYCAGIHTAWLEVDCGCIVICWGAHSLIAEVYCDCMYYAGVHTAWLEAEVQKVESVSGNLSIGPKTF